jgi:uncharacterized protein (TIGR02246 family)
MIASKQAAKVLYLMSALALYGVVAVAADPPAVAAIHAVDQAWVKAYNSGDVDTVVSLYAEDAVLLPPGAPQAIGRGAIRAYFEQDMAAAAKGGIKVSLDAKTDGGASGNMGWASGTYVAKDKSGHVVESGKYLSVSKKIDGKWRYVRDTWNSDGTPGSPPAQK